MATARGYFDEIWRMERRLRQKTLLAMEYRRKAERCPSELEMSMICCIDLEREIAKDALRLAKRKQAARAMIRMLPDASMRRAMESRYLSGYAGSSRREPLGALRIVAKYLPGQPGHELIAKKARDAWQ